MENKNISISKQFFTVMTGLVLLFIVVPVLIALLVVIWGFLGALLGLY